MENQDQGVYRPKSEWSDGMNTGKPEMSGFYVLERQIGKTCEMVNFYLRSGVERAFSVMGFDEITYDPSNGIVIRGRSVTIQIAGRHLGELHKHLVARKVKEVREYVEALVNENELVIEEIGIHSDYDGH